MSQARRSVKNYHYDNGRFADNGFVDAINSKIQKLDFCGVEAHRQNSIIEKTEKRFNNMHTNASDPWYKNVASNDKRHVLSISNEKFSKTAKNFASRHPRADTKVYFSWC